VGYFHNLNHLTLNEVEKHLSFRMNVRNLFHYKYKRSGIKRSELFARCAEDVAVRQ